MSDLPDITGLVDQNSPHLNTQAQAITWFTSLQGFLSGLLGSTGTKLAALTSLFTSLGTSGQILTSNGSGSVPTFQNPASTATLASLFSGKGGTSGQIYTSTGVNTEPTFQSMSMPTLTSLFTGVGTTGQVWTSGGSGASSFQTLSMPTESSLFYGHGTAGQVYTSTGANAVPTFQTLALPTEASLFTGHGTTGQVYTSNGAGQIPSFQNASTATLVSLFHGLGTAGQVWTSNGVSGDASFQNATGGSNAMMYTSWGTAGQVLQSNGSGVAPSFTNLPTTPTLASLFDNQGAITQVWTSHASGNSAGFAYPAVISALSLLDSSTRTGTGVVPTDSTTPLVTEGWEVFSFYPSVTPSTHYTCLTIELSMFIVNPVAGDMITVSVFRAGVLQGYRIVYTSQNTYTGTVLFTAHMSTRTAGDGTQYFWSLRMGRNRATSDVIGINNATYANGYMVSTIQVDNKL